MITATPSERDVLIVIPALNEARHIERVLTFASAFAARVNGLVIVTDGGSDDATCDIVRRRASGDPLVRLIDNPARLQSAGVNLAVANFGDRVEWLLRLDAHSQYPNDYGDILLAEAQQHGADSVVVSMHAEGQGFLQQVVADAQNSRLGNGGSAHRLFGEGTWVDHGHHALMRIDAFRAVGGYDDQFSHNEDAELDHRLRAAGHRIWLTGRTSLTYFPRSRIGPLIRQYYNFGRGRARNLLKNKTRPAARQAVVAMLAPALALVLFTPISWAFALPLVLWMLACFAGGVMIALQTGRPRGLLAGLIAGIMHMAWSAGFWRHWLARRPVGTEKSTA
ncbi:glycosyltransferase [Paracoccus sp. JM45]|uniref:glycosyltransferase n=1 Tax=Paracoccus sp. JM45 TaxID=2283626 RepID=UPI000E6CA3D6|nr:glycosyltransferase [Paracoccus sp. JM45]RJE78713.1 glycosyltransferase [Paracoccus sp. JM45]